MFMFKILVIFPAFEGFFFNSFKLATTELATTMYNLELKFQRFANIEFLQYKYVYILIIFGNFKQVESCALYPIGQNSLSYCVAT